MALPSVVSLHTTAVRILGYTVLGFEQPWLWPFVALATAYTIEIGLEIIGAPVARDTDGLALSSRNAFIEPDERPRANQLFRTLSWTRDQILAGRRDYRELEQEAIQQITEAGFRVDYFAVCSAQNLQPAVDDDRDLAILGALFTARARLIDNVTLSLDE